MKLLIIVLSLFFFTSCYTKFYNASLIPARQHNRIESNSSYYETQDTTLIKPSDASLSSINISDSLETVLDSILVDSLQYLIKELKHISYKKDTIVIINNRKLLVYPDEDLYWHFGYMPQSWAYCYSCGHYHQHGNYYCNSRFNHHSYSIWDEYHRPWWHRTRTPNYYYTNQNSIILNEDSDKPSPVPLSSRNRSSRRNTRSTKLTPSYVPNSNAITPTVYNNTSTSSSSKSDENVKEEVSDKKEDEETVKPKKRNRSRRSKW